MKVSTIRALVIYVFLCAPVCDLRAQEFARQIAQFVGANARQFLQPVVDGFMADINAGMYTIPTNSEFHTELQFVFVGAMMGEDQKTFVSTPFNETVEFQYNGVPFLGDLEIPSTVLPTAVGMSKSVTFTGRLKRIRPKGLPYIPGPNDLITQDATATIGGSGDISMIPLFAPQLTVGSLAGTELTIRFLPTMSLGDVGRVGVLGIGIRHDVGRYFTSPIDVALQVHYQSLQMKGTTADADFSFDASAFAFQLQAGKLFGSKPFQFGPIVSLGHETGSVIVEYSFADPYLGNQSVEFSGMSHARVSLGVQASLAFVTLTAAYNIAPVNAFSVSSGFVYEF